MDEKQKNTKECPRNSILDFNFSWVLLIVYLAFLFGIWFAQNQTAQFVPGDYVGAPYFFISCLLFPPLQRRKNPLCKALRI